MDVAEPSLLGNTDTLLSMAEIAAAFAGFAALVTVLRRRPDAPTAEAAHDLLRLRLVISSAVTGVLAALVPVGLAGYGFSPELVWKLAAMIFLVFDNAIIASFLRAYRPVRGAFPPDRVAASIVATVEVLEQGSLFIVALGLAVSSASALYVTALILNICQAGFIFVRFVGSTFTYATEGESSPPVDRSP